MVAKKKDLIATELEAGTGAAISIAVNESGLRTGLKIWFGDLEEKQGAVAELRPHGLKSHRVELSFGPFSGPVVAQIRQAKAEDVQLARALVASLGDNVKVEIPGQDMAKWLVKDGTFRLIAIIRHEAQPDEDESISATCRDVIVPLMAAMAELIGYDIVEDTDDNEVPAFEGALTRSVVNRRERNPRNRLLCIRIHGEKCFICAAEPQKIYGEAGTIIEVHHLEPLASLGIPKAYNPETDLVPLCPNCHRAVHTRRPVPFAIDEMKTIMEDAYG